jgi:hypothetical protein
MSGQTCQDIKDNLSRVLEMVMEFGCLIIPMKIVIDMKANIKMIVKAVSECIVGKMEQSTKDSF